MDERIERLNEIAQHGNIDAFYIKIPDVKLLEHIDELPFVDTPLHIFAYNGHVPFSIEMMKLKPSFVNLMTRNEAVLHVALKYDKLEAFKYLVGWLVKNRFLLE
uniref:Ankyrin repeat-containing protein n=1 Tax=Quercus lobata TaxID=97700 RepID=A0A7N2QX58_QUELO